MFLQFGECDTWVGMNHDVSHLIFFGCVAYAHVLDELRKKLDKKGHKCIFFGYSEDTKAYNLYDPVTRKVIISRDVQFVKNESWDGNVDINVNIVSNVDNDDMEEEVVQTPHVSQPVIAPSTPHDTLTWFSTRTINTRSSSSYTDKYTKRTTNSIKHFIKVDIDRTNEDKKSA